MPTAYHVFAVRRFPHARRFAANTQLTLLGDDENNMEMATTDVEQSAEQPVPLFQRYHVQHDHLVTLRFPGRARGKTFREYVTPYRFSIYLAAETPDGPFRPLLVRTKKKVAQDFVQRMTRERDGFDTAAVVLDFERLRPRLEVIRGAWFGKIRAPHLQATGVFGHHVDRSAEFQHAETVGEMTNLLVEIEINEDLSQPVMFTAEGGIVLYAAYLDEAEEMEVVTSVLANLLAGCLAPRQ